MTCKSMNKPNKLGTPIALTDISSKSEKQNLTPEKNFEEGGFSVLGHSGDLGVFR